MNNYQILNNIRKHILLNDTEKELFLSSIVIKSVLKRELILYQGQICKKIFFVEDGSLRAFNLNKDGKETTIMFAIKDWWITDMYSFINQKPALLHIEALENSIIVELDFYVLEELYKRVPTLERFFRIIFQNAYVREQLRVLHNISLSTEERYEQFIEKYPAMVEKITQKQIASYLGVTPEFLSAIKKK